MRITDLRSKRLPAILCAVVLMVAYQGCCNLGAWPVAATEEAPPEEPMPPPEEPMPGGEPHILLFVAHRTEIQQGECTALEWQVEGGFGVEVNGQRVDFVGGMDVCPAETTLYHLVVDGGDRIAEEEIVINVLLPQPGEGDRPPEPTEPPTDQEPTPGENPPNPAIPTSNATTATSPVPKPPTPTPIPSPQNCKNASGMYITDLAITDIYAGNMPKGQFWVRITNHGPVACTNIYFEFLGCAVLAYPKTGGPGIASAEKIPVTLNIRPGETQNIPTGMGLDTDQNTYTVTCHFAAESGYSDLNNTNQYYQENIP